MMRDLKCPYCGSFRVEPTNLTRLDMYGNVQTLWCCRECGECFWV